MRERSKRRRTLAATLPGTGSRTFSDPSQDGPGGGTHAVDEVHYGPVWASWREANRWRCVTILVASMVVLSIGCGHENPTAPTSTIPPAPSVNPTPVRLANYEVVFVADAGCTDLPPVVRTRTYAGSFDGFRLDLSGSEFGADWNVMSLKLDGDGAYVNASDPPIWERPTPDTDSATDDEQLENTAARVDRQDGLVSD